MNLQAIQIIVALTIAIVGLIFSTFNFFIGKYVATKVLNNDLKHLTQDVKEIKNNDKDFKNELKNELHNIHLAINRIEKRIITRDAICEERHKQKK